RVTVSRRAHLRYDGTDTAIPVPLTEPPGMIAEFEAAYRRTYSFLLDRPLVVEAVAVEAVGRTEHRLDDLGHGGMLGSPQPPREGLGRGVARVRMYADDRWRSVPLHQREVLPAGATVIGPAIITEANATTVVDDGWRASVTPHGHLLVERVTAPAAPSDVGTDPDPVLLEIFNNLFMSIAEQMGARLESTAQSVNIKERLDFSCALFDPDGNLIANAPHMPVHLG